MSKLIVNLYQQWAHGQTLLEQSQRKKLFVKMVSTIYGHTEEEIELEIQEYLKYSNFNEIN